MSGLLSEFERVNQRHQCVLCGRTKYCMRRRGQGDEAVDVICTQVESRWRWGAAGWFHPLSGKRRDATPFFRRPFTINLQPKADRDAIADKVRYWQRSIRPDLIDHLHRQIGVSPATLRRLGIGWSAKRNSYTFPSYNGAGLITGARTRDALTSEKKAVFGYPLGLILPMPYTFAAHADLCIAEGESDTGTLLDFEFAAIGRPGCACCIDLTIDFIIRNRPGRVLVFSDNDEVKADGSTPGIDGARRLAHAVLPYVREVRVVLPPAKDVRQWKAQGATPADVLAAIDAAEPMRPHFIFAGARRAEVLHG